VERRKALVFETTRTLMRAFELALRGSQWTLVKIQQEGRLFPAIESASPDVVIVERRALSDETREALATLPLPIVYCAVEKSGERGERLFLPRPFSCDELFDALKGALEWSPDLDEEPASEAIEEEEQPLVLSEPDEEERPFASPMDEEMKQEDDLPVPEITETRSPAPETVAVEEFVEDPPAITEEPIPVAAAEEASPAAVLPADLPEAAPVAEPVAPAAFDAEPAAPSVVEQIAERVEERVVEELIPADAGLSEGAPMPEMVRAIVRRELREVMKEYFWEEAPQLMRQILEEEIRKLAVKQ